VTGTGTSTTTTKAGLGGVVSSLIGKVTSHSDANNVRPAVVERAMGGGYAAMVAGIAVVVGMAGFVERLL
jgi:hypothetical protein